MADTLETGQTRALLVDGRDPTPDEAITADDAGAIITIDASTGRTLVTGVSDGTATITVQPGAADVNKLAGSDTITVSTPIPPTELVVTLE